MVHHFLLLHGCFICETGIVCRPWCETEVASTHFVRSFAGASESSWAPLKPFEDTEALEQGVENMMRRLDPELGDQFAAIRANMDLAARPGKGQGGFMTWYSWDRRPFIFANAAGNHNDIVTLLHEAGHAFHSLASSQADASPMETVSAPMEFNEVASMAMERISRLSPTASPFML